MKPILKYRGGKSKELKYYLKYIENEKFNVYFEPFFGGGATYFALETFEKAIVNDVNFRLMNFYSDVKNNFSQLKKELTELECIYRKNQEEFENKKILNPNKIIHNKNEDLYYEMRKEFNYPTNKMLDSTIYFFINKTAYSGMTRYNSRGEYNVPYGRYKNFNTNLLNENHHLIFQKTDIFNTDYSEIFNMATPNDIMFLDPPYDCTFNDYGNGDNFTIEQQIKLAQDFKNLNTRCLMIIGETSLTKELYKDYIIEKYDKRYGVNIKNRFDANAIHLIIKNF